MYTIDNGVKRRLHSVSPESKTSASAASKSPVKKAAGPKGPRKTKGRGGAANSDTSQTPTVEERRCPLDGCDSMGHLGGRAEKHFTVEACPKYHNKTAQECKVSGCVMDSECHQYEDLGLFQLTVTKNVPYSPSLVVHNIFYL